MIQFQEPARAYESCPSCNGSGLAHADYTGEPTECYECGGNTVVRGRDARGRFVAFHNEEPASAPSPGDAQPGSGVSSPSSAADQFGDREQMNYTLKRPCVDCPFLRGKDFLTRSRARQIATDVLIHGKTFSCHKTLDYSGDDEDNEPAETKTTQHCAGALVMCEKADRPNQMMRIAERLGLYDASKLDMTADVYRTPADMATGHGRTRP